MAESEPTVRRIRIDPGQVKDGLTLFTAKEQANEAWEEWLQERRKANGIAESADVRYNPVTGLLIVVEKPVGNV